MDHFDLRHGLAELGNEPVAGEDALPVRSLEARVRRGRALRTTGIGAVAATAVLGLTVGVQALPMDGRPGPPAGSPAPTVSAPPSTVEPTEEPTADPTVEPTPQDTSTPPSPAVPAPLLALTADGELVEVEPATGQVVRVVASGFSVDDPDKIGLTVAPDGDRAWLTTWDDDRVSPLVREVSLGDGSARVVGVGIQPAVSPDGATLAYPGPVPGRDFGDTWGLNLLDVSSGEVRHLSEPFSFESVLFGVDWSADGSSLVHPSSSGASLSILPATASSLEESVRVGTTDPSTGVWADQQTLPSGNVLVSTADADVDPARTGWAVVDPSSGAVVREGATGGPDGVAPVVDVATHPREERAALLVGDAGSGPEEPVGWRMVAWADGTLTDLGGNYVAVGW